MKKKKLEGKFELLPTDKLKNKCSLNPTTKSADAQNNNNLQASFILESIVLESKTNYELT